jgi:hypothetical protein
MGTCSRCGSPRTGADRCQFCGLSFVAVPVTPMPPVDDVEPVAEEPAYQFQRPAGEPAAKANPSPRPYAPVVHQPVAHRPAPQPPVAPQPTWTPPAPEDFTPPTRAVAGSGIDLGGVGWATGRLLGLYLPGCVVLTGLLALMLSPAHGIHPLDWFRGGVIVACLGLRGAMFGAAQSAGQGGDLHLGLTPVVLLVGALALAYRTGRLAEQKALSADHRQAVLRGGLSAVACTFALALLAVVCRFESSVDLGSGLIPGTSARLGAQVLPLLVYGTPLLATALAAGRSVTYRTVFDLPSLRAELATRTASLSDWLRPIATHAAVSATAFAGVLFCYGLADSSVRSTGHVSLLSLSGMLGYLAGSANVGLYGAATMMGIGVGTHTTGTDGDHSEGFGLLHGDITGLDLGWVLVPLLVALAVGLREAYRRPASAWWHGGVASLVVWSALAFVMRMRFSASGSEGSAGVTAGLELLTLLPMSFLYGLLLQYGGQALAGPVLRNAPGLARALGYAPPVVEEPRQHLIWR